VSARQRGAHFNNGKAEPAQGEHHAQGRTAQQQDDEEAEEGHQPSQGFNGGFHTPHRANDNGSAQGKAQDQIASLHLHEDSARF
jgi:hypothetical protein